MMGKGKKRSKKGKKRKKGTEEKERESVRREERKERKGKREREDFPELRWSRLDGPSTKVGTRSAIYV